MSDETTQSEALSKTYTPAEIEGAIYARWLESQAFHARPDERPRERRYVVMMPLPNVTGALHMGHAIDNVMQDLLIRWHRMQGDNTLWMPGTDHAGIATQAVVEKRLKELEGLTRHELGREGLVARIWQWKDQYQARIIAQQQRMGCSCDWKRQRFTMDAVCARAVRHAFFRMFEDDLIFRGNRLVNWDPFLRTSISDDEIYHAAVQGHFWHLRYPVIDAGPGEPSHVVVATTRPETMLGDTAVAVHPDPEAALAARLGTLEQELALAPEKERPALASLVEELRERQRTLLPGLVQLAAMARAGRKVRLPLLGRELPLICDLWAKPELGSGCVKITPAHDHNDYEVYRRHQAEIAILNILCPDGTLNENAGPYQGLDRFVARDRVVADLTEQQLVERVEDREIEIGHSDRSKSPVEPYLSDQWFIRMGDVPGGIAMGAGTAKEHRAAGLVQAAIDAVTSGRVRVHPERYAKTYLDWLAEKRDWPISRQLWWGHRIPVWSREVAVAEREPLLAELAREGLEPRAGASVQARGEGETRRLEVCLLEDREAQIRILESRGFERDPDVLDTWFSSALWPFSTLGWPDPASAALEAGQAPLGAEGDAASCLDYYYPGSCLVTARDIITLWVARMVLAGLYCKGEIPFSDVFIHANILDGKGERMSKSKGNGIDPVDIIDAYGTDAMRYVLCDMQTGTQDIRLPVTAICPRCGHKNDLGATAHGASIFSYVCGKGSGKTKEGCGGEFDVLGTIPNLPAAKLISERFEVGRAFCNKLWNSARFVFMNLCSAPPSGVNPPAPPTSDVPSTLRRDELALEDRWILDQLSGAVREVQRGLEEYNPAAALGAARDFFWSSLCDWYLELVKPRLLEGAEATSAAIARQILSFCLDQTLRLLHPFVPFVTEHLWQRLGELCPARGLGELASAPPAELLIAAAWPAPIPALEDPALRALFVDLQAITRAVREVRTGLGLPPRQSLQVTLKPPAARAAALREQAHVMTRLACVGELRIDPEATRTPGSASKVVGDLQIFVHGVVDDAEERDRLKKSLAKVEKEVASWEKKLSDPRFTERAPAEVVSELRERLAASEQTRAALRANLEELG